MGYERKGSVRDDVVIKVMPLTEMVEEQEIGDGHGGGEVRVISSHCISLSLKY